MSEPAATPFEAPPELARWQGRALLVGLAAAVVCVAGSFFDRDQFFYSYLLGYLFWLGIPLGCLALVLLYHLTYGAWGAVARRILEAASRTVPLLGLLALPIAFGMHEIFPWSDAGHVAGDPLLRHKAPYLNVPGFWLRHAVYFLVWSVPALVLSRLSRLQDQEDDPRLRRRMRLVSGPALAAFCLAASFASFDWLMSLDPHWYSTIYGVYFVGTLALSGLTFLIATAWYLGGREPLSRVLEPERFHDYGKLLLAFVMLWAYFSFSQYFIIWSGNIPEGVSWYVERRHGSWPAVSVALVVLHFVVPFLLLLSRPLKRRAGSVAGVALLLLAMRWIDLSFQTGPSLGRHFSVHLLDVAAFLAVGGLWLALFLRELRRLPLLALGDPALAQVLDDD